MQITHRISNLLGDSIDNVVRQRAQTPNSDFFHLISLQGYILLLLPILIYILRKIGRLFLIKRLVRFKLGLKRLWWIVAEKDLWIVGIRRIVGKVGEFLRFLLNLLVFFDPHKSSNSMQNFIQWNLGNKFMDNKGIIWVLVYGEPHIENNIRVS